MAIYIWVKIGSGNDLFPSDSKLLVEPMFTYHQREFYGIDLNAISQEMPGISIIDMRLKITNLGLQLYPQGPMSWLSFI